LCNVSKETDLKKIKYDSGNFGMGRERVYLIIIGVYEIFLMLVDTLQLGFISVDNIKQGRYI